MVVYRQILICRVLAKAHLWKIKIMGIKNKPYHLVLNDKVYLNINILYQ
ncbi:hypothetical protein CLL_A2144 [Clostridium botulinum B str. Eklund 17B (NRP)]|uniref:Uncharacterized protein n=1 Tax=Clostridium botulinum (strain Eklund 17B / Type B) TaxID=935198 RepID=B2TLQ1_CLOBB|nr:hypothetical protein CLL_A2144 [Clostridium botulinum B str. Eklund 17B (NRP)]CDH91050.1 hypothetical protein CB17B2061 [Clostridium botulinum B str. Eklund 17B (NRP)]